jgi:hypothetical protein
MIRSRDRTCPRGGADASRTSAGASLVSRYFCTTNPPIECSIGIGCGANGFAIEESQNAKSAVGEEVQKVHIPAPSTLEGAMNKEQRVWVLIAELTLVDYV